MTDVKDSPSGTMVADAKTHANDSVEVKQLKKALEKAQKQIAKQAEIIEASSPTIDVRKFLFDTRDDVLEFYAPKTLRDMAQAELAAINKQRTRDGYDRVTYDDDEWEAAIEETIESLLADRRGNVAEQGPLLRTLKMGAPDGSLRQIPYEGQFNNIAGSLEDGYRKYTAKGFKRTDPMLCPAGDCWEESATKDGSMLFTGYCSQDHFDRTENGGASKVPGVTTGNTISA